MVFKSEEISKGGTFECLEERKEEFTLFGGEPLMLPLKDLERVFQWGFKNYGRNTISNTASNG